MFAFLILQPLTNFLSQANGTASPSIATTMLSQLDKGSSKEDELLAKQLTANMYIAGADTVWILFDTR